MSASISERYVSGFHCHCVTREPYAGEVTRFASVFPLVNARALAREFTYSVPDEVGPGAIVEVPFGNARRRGVVTAVDVPPPDGIEAVAVGSVVGEVPPALIELALWLADYYGSTPARALALVAPESPKRRKLQAPPAERQELADESAPPELSVPQRAAVTRIVEAIDAGGANL